MMIVKALSLDRVQQRVVELIVALLHHASSLSPRWHSVGRSSTMRRSTGLCVPASASSEVAANKIILALLHILCACCMPNLTGRSSCTSSMPAHLMSDGGSLPARGGIEILGRLWRDPMLQVMWRIQEHGTVEPPVVDVLVLMQRQFSSSSCPWLRCIRFSSPTESSLAGASQRTVQTVQKTVAIPLCGSLHTFYVIADLGF